MKARMIFMMTVTARLSQYDWIWGDPYPLLGEEESYGILLVTYYSSKTCGASLVCPSWTEQLVT